MSEPLGFILATIMTFLLSFAGIILLGFILADKLLRRIAVYALIVTGIVVIASALLGRV